ncbi:DNA-binding transcriptional ArsR family regulator [Altererythrobacter atlanticus]|uniref:Biofilm growth-associated repressor n=1 Tax=Croceibacterium atlanticum TaxID=1267766 RepID=A0A0F7KU65_9SPHN|nr:metalloregulator ArsR/SmtB family transcription factor [Croceibacterium atlanticum]AKH42817.1 Biofilm growth-associated repressor [Croceibacterium atlanticum]MBB5731597.1 DNA-binding transcriptional ArsR family regulator [Croceibacterium atlanticum]
MNAETMQRDFEGSADMLRALAHSVRLQILCAIKDTELSVGEIEEATGIVQPGLSQQLSVLRKAGLVTTRREGKQIFYQVARDRLTAASDLLDALAGTAARRTDASTARIHSGGGAAVFAKIRR